MNPPVATRRRLPWGRILFVVVTIGLLVVVAGQFLSAEALLADLAKADWRWTGVAVILQGLFFLLYGPLYQAGFRAVDVESRALPLVPVLFASIFAKTAVPLTAAPAAAVFIDDASERGQSGTRTAVGIIVVLAIDILTALPFVIAGTLALLARSTLVEFALVGTGLFALFTVGVIGALALAALQPGWLRGLLAVVRRLVNRGARLIRRRPILFDDWEDETTAQLASAVSRLPRHRRDLAIAALYGFAIHAVNMAGLAAIFLAFGQPLEIAALAAGFGMSIVFFIIAIVPDGVGAVEGAMALVFVQLGMPAAAAVLVTLLFRILNVWIPVLIGFWCARRLRLFGAGRRESQGVR